MLWRLRVVCGHNGFEKPGCHMITNLRSCMYAPVVWVTVIPPDSAVSVCVGEQVSLIVLV